MIYKTNNAVILAVDTAERSGWSVFCEGAWVESGEIDMLRETSKPAQACLLYKTRAENAGLPFVLVYEKPYRGVLQGQYIGAWRMAWCAAECVKGRWLGVAPGTWRKHIHPPGRRRRSREELRADEVLLARQVVGRDVGHDEAAAILIAQWAAHAPEVNAKLPKRYQWGQK